MHTVTATPNTKTWDSMNDCAKQAHGDIPAACADSFKDSTVTGFVREAKMNQGSIDLGLSISDTPLLSRNLTCQLDAGQFKDQATRLTQGDSVTVKGMIKSETTNGTVTEIVLAPCELTNSPAPAPH
jgi:hypothetical protein